MSYAYKHLAASDLRLMLGLLPMFGEAFGEADTYQGAVPSDAYLTKLLADIGDEDVSEAAHV